MYIWFDILHHFMYSEEIMKYHMILKCIHSSSSPVKETPIAPGTVDYFLSFPGSIIQSHSRYSFVTNTTVVVMITLTVHSSIIKLFLWDCLSSTQLLFLWVSLSFTLWLLCCETKEISNCPQYGKKSKFFFPCPYVHYKNNVLAGPSLSKVIVLIILMNKCSFNSKKGKKGSILDKFQPWQHFL